MKTTMKKKLGLLGAVAAAAGVVYAVKKRKVIAEKATNLQEGVKERAALGVHSKVGMPTYRYLRDKNYIPF